MFWKILSGAARAAFHVNKAVTGFGAALVIGIGVYDFIKRRK